MSSVANRIPAPKRRTRIVVSGEAVSYQDVDVEITPYDLTQALNSLEHDDLVEVLSGLKTAGYNPLETTQTVERLYYATRTDLWTIETRREVQDLLAELVGRAS